MALLGPLFLAGCSLSVPIKGGDEAPAITGSVATPVRVQQPLPQTLAYSDAAKIGQAAAATMWQAKSEGGDWINTLTGSSGTVAGGKGTPELAENCKPFSTMVTSIGGVHSYSGTICRGGAGGSVVQLESPTGDAHS